MKIFKKAIFVLAIITILGAYACSKDDREQPITETPKSGVPSNLVGDWMESWSLSMQYIFDPLLIILTPKYGSGEATMPGPWIQDPVLVCA